MKKKTTKFVSIILSVLLIFSVMPMTVLATDSVSSVTTIFGEVTEFSTLSEAKDYACENVGSTLTLLTDIEIGDNEFHIVDCDFTLDLNGKTLSCTTSNVIYIHRGGKLTIKDSVGTGVVTCASAKTSGTSAIVHCGELIIESGTFIGKDYAVRSCDKIVVKGGTFIGNKRGLEIIRTDAVSFVDTCDLEIGGRYGEYLNGYGQLVGGTFVNGIYINNYDRWDEVFGPVYIPDIIPDGYGFFDEDVNEVFADINDLTISKTVTVKESNNERPNVAKIENIKGETEYFVDISSALSYVSRNYQTKLTLLKDVEGTGIFQIRGYGPFELDLNGKTISSSACSTLIINNQRPVKITDSIGGGQIINTYESDEISLVNDVAVKVTADAVIENITITSKSSTGLFVGKTATVNNCKISSDSHGILCNTKSTLNFNDSISVGGEYGIFVTERTKLNVDGGTIAGNARGIYYPVTSNSELATICLSDCTIKGGMEREHSTQKFSKFLAEGYVFCDMNGNEVNIDGDSIPTNHVITQDLVVKNKYPVSVIQPDGTTEYFPSVEEGVNSANRDFDSILKILTDILLNSTLTFKGTTTLDLNGKNVAINDDYDYTVVVDEGASLNIDDSKENGTIGGGGVAVNGGTLNFNNGNIESSMDGIYNNGGDVTVNGGAISSEYGYDDIFVENEGTTKIYGGTYEDGFSIWGATINEALGEDYAFYSADGAVEIDDNQKEISDNVVVYEKTIVTAMSSQIRFNKNDDGSYAGTFDVRTRAKISDADFNKYIAGSTEEATEKISKVGFVYAQAKNGFDINVAKTVAQGDKADGFVDAPVSYIQDADGYYMFTCLVTGIPEEELDNGLIAYAYICLDDTWYFFPVEVTAEFGEMYSTYYPIAAEQYGWEV